MTHLFKAGIAITIMLMSNAAVADTNQYFESIKNDPLQLQMFLYQMPKGGDIHNHLDGASYAENLITP